MSFSLGVFDVFTYAATGSLYVACLAYVLDRLALVDLGQVQTANTTVLLLGVLLLAYLLGHMFYVVGELIDRIVPGQQDHRLRAGARLGERVPGERSKVIAKMDPHLLLAGIEIRAREAAQEVTRLRAVGLALRNCVPAWTIATAISVIEVFTSGRPIVAVVAAAFFLATTWMTVRRGRDLRAWAVMKTFELAYWMPELIGPKGPTVAGSPATAAGEQG